MSTTETFPDRADHRHTDRCWWNADQATWICPSPDTGTDTGTAGTVDRPLVDVRDMLVVHTALLREFRLAPAAVTRVPIGDRRRAALVDRHLGLLCQLLHHHHTGEDRLLWPLLRARLPRRDLARIEQAETQHADIERALDGVATARRSWTDDADGDGRQLLAEALQQLHDLLAEHLDGEERNLLPLAAAHLTAAEWRAVGQAGAAGIPRSAMPLVFGMFAYEGDPEVLASMLDEAPALARRLIAGIAPRVYARRAAQVHGTARP